MHPYINSQDGKQFYSNEKRTETDIHMQIFLLTIDLSGSGVADILPALNLTNLTCREDFFEQNFTCIPRCDRWNLRPENLLVTIEDIVRVTFAVLQWFMDVPLLIVFAVRWKAL